MRNNPGLLKTIAVVAIAAIISSLVSVSISFPATFVLPHDPPVGIQTAVGVKLFVSTFNVVILTALLWNYVVVYRDLPNRFTLSLMLISVALLLYAVSSNPLLPMALGFRHGTALGPFVFLPDAFASAAAIVLLYQSYA
jgi:hypothetical protein